MDVERLMQDLSVSQLQNIYSSLSVEMESKKEELRQMVGRRYRDVLEASSAVKRVTHIADMLVDAVHDMRNVNEEKTLRNAVKSNRVQLWKVSSLSRLFSLIEGIDPVSDVFTLLLIEMIHRQLLSEIDNSNNSYIIVSHFSSKIIRGRRRLEEEILNKLGSLTKFDDLAAHIIALLLIKKISCDELVGLLFERKIQTTGNWSSPSHFPSMTDLICELRSVLESMKQIFLDGYLIESIATMAGVGWIPKSIDRFLKDETLAFGKLIRKECCTLNEYFATFNVGCIDNVAFNQQCVAFLNQICELSQNVIEVKCKEFDNPAKIIDFLKVILPVFEGSWPIVGNGMDVYKTFFGTKIIEKFKSLIESDLQILEDNFMKNVLAVNCHPAPIFNHKASKFNIHMASGVSEELLESVDDFNSRLEAIHSCVKEFSSMCFESTKEKMIIPLDKLVVDLVERISDAHLKYVSNKEATPLTMARFYLAILLSRCPSVCTCIGRNNELIVRCIKLIRESFEEMLILSVDEIIERSAKDSRIETISKSFSDSFDFIPYVQELEKTSLPDVGLVEVPVHINRCLYDFLQNICHEVSMHSLGHLCTKGVRNHIGNKIVGIVTPIYEQIVSENDILLSRIALQSLFDIRVLAVLFPTESLRSLIPSLETKLDPFDLSLLSVPVIKNSRIAAHRYSVIFEHLLVEPIANKEATLNDSYTAVVDCVPRIHDMQRFSLLPRLSKSKDESSAKLRTTSSLSTFTPKKESTSSSSVRGTPSFSSFYKLPTSWFGG